MTSDSAGSMPELEAALAAQPDDRDLLAVYADALVARGDPRGELIALDLHVERAGAAPSALWARREELERIVLGSPEAELPAARLRRGFLELDYDVLADEDVTDDLLERPIGHYLRRLRVVAEQPGRAVSVLVRALAHPRPHLMSLALACRPGDVGRAPTLDPAVVPRLRTLALAGYAVPLAPVAHPGVVTLDLNFRVACAWAADCRVHPAVETLVVTVGSDGRDRVLDLMRVGFPRLRTIQLRGAASIPAAELAELRERLAMSTPHVAVVEAPPKPWPHSNRRRGHGELAIEVPGVDFTGPVPVGPMLAVMDSYFHDLPPAAQSAWAALWQLHVPVLPRRGSGERARLPAQLLATALDALPPHVLAKLRPWQALRAALGPEPSRRLDVMIAEFRRR